MESIKEGEEVKNKMILTEIIAHWLTLLLLLVILFVMGIKIGRQANTIKNLKVQLEECEQACADEASAGEYEQTKETS